MQSQSASREQIDNYLPVGVVKPSMEGREAGPVQSFALEVEGVSKSFGAIRALNNVTLRVQPGQVYGLLGPNGSGKSTLMKTVLGLVRPDGGKIIVYGLRVDRDPIAVKRIVGYVPEAPRLYDFLTGVEYLDFVADIYGLSAAEKRERITEFLSALELEGRENDMINGYSQGMRQKLAITAALLHRPRLLVLDEPLNGLDPKSARIVKELLHKLSQEGVTTIFSTHILEIAEAICDRMSIMYEGQVIAEGTVADLRDKADLPGSTLEEVFLKLTGTMDLREVVEALAR
ncbi:MAG: ABC transporter ATP-binding protein [Candidatus Bathyarchaeia archaeon]